MSLGVLPLASLKDSPIIVDVRKFQVHTAAVSINLLTLYQTYLE